MAVQLEFQTTYTRVLRVEEAEQEGVEGYLVYLGAETQFVPKDDADRIARFILFGDEEPPAE